MMKKENVFLVSLIAMLAVTNVRADIASSAYVDAKVGPVEQALTGKQDVSNMVKATSGTGLTNNLTSTSKYPSMATASQMITDALSGTVTDVTALQDTGVKHTKSTATGSETVPVYVAADGTATPITSYSGNAATATKATQDASGNVITSTYATKSELETTNSNVTANTNAISAINNESTGILKTAKDYTDSQISGITTGDNSLNSRLTAAEDTISQHTSDISTLNSNKQSKLSDAQISATNSGITSTKVGNYDDHIADDDIHVTAAQKTAWSGKQDAINDLADIRSGAAAGATAVQPSAISKMQNTDNIVTATSGTGLTNNTTSTTKYPSMATASAMITDALSSTATDVSTLQDTSVKHTKSTAAGSATVPVYVAADGTATPITSYSGKAATAGVADSANAVAWDNVSGKPSTYAPANHASSKVTSMTGYAKADSAAAISTSDSLNTAIGKLEKALDSKQASGNYVTANSAITPSGSTNKIVQYDAKGLVVGGTTAGALATKSTIKNADVASDAAIASSKIADLSKVVSATAGNKDGTFVLTAKVTDGVASYYWEDLGR